MLIAFEGVDGVGKTTIIEGLKKKLNSKTSYMKFPEDTALCDISNPAEAALGFINEFENQQDDIKSNLKYNRHVVCDRYIFSLAYQCAQMSSLEPYLYDFVARLYIKNPVDIIFFVHNGELSDERVRAIIACYTDLFSVIYETRLDCSLFYPDKPEGNVILIRSDKFNIQECVNYCYSRIARRMNGHRFDQQPFIDLALEANEIGRSLM